jgi:CDK-activating kinase assembly factor MAT1
MSRPDLLDSIGITADSQFALFQSGITDPSNRLPEYRSPNDMCPICKTDRYSKPSLRLLISPCYHKLCERCVDHLFSIGAGKCPHEGCTRVLRKTNFIHQTFEDLGVEREVGVRRRVGTM